VRTAERLFQTYQYGETGHQIYDFFWSELADWYIEVAKLQLAEGGDRAYNTARTLVRVLDLCLRLLHPFIPFVTEEIWGNLRKALMDTPLADLASGWGDALINAPWPESRQKEGWEDGCVADFNLVQETIRSIRNIRAEKNVKPGKRIPGMLSAGGKTELFNQQRSVISALAQLDSERFVISTRLPPKQENQVGIAIGAVEIYLPLEGLVDTAAERERITKALSEAEGQVARLEKLLSSSFAERAPTEIVQKEKEKLAGFLETVDKLKNQLEELEQ
jgi:valyl-tRNA synthetase